MHTKGFEYLFMTMKSIFRLMYTVKLMTNV